MEQYVIFQSHQQYFALSVLDVVRVIEVEAITSLPEVPQFVLGVYDFQGEMIPIIDVGQKLFLKETDQTSESKIILCTWKSQTIGLVVETIQSIGTLTKASYEENELNNTIKQHYIAEFLKLDTQLVLLLDLAYFFTLQQEEMMLEQFDHLEGNLDGYEQ